MSAKGRCLTGQVLLRPMLTFHIEQVPLAWTPNIFLWNTDASISETGEIVNVMVKGARKTLYKGDNADIDNPLVQPP